MSDEPNATSSADRPTVVHSNHFVPRFGMYAGPGYAGGREWSDGQVPDKTAWEVRPVNFLDDATRNHDKNYTFVEQNYAKGTPEYKAGLWQADKEMLVNVLNYKPAEGDWLTATYRDALIRSFVAKAVNEYGIDIQKEWADLGKLDSGYAQPAFTSTGEIVFGVPGLIHSASTYMATGMEQLSTSGLNIQAALLFNQHINPNYIRPLNATSSDGQPLPAWQATDRIVIPQREGNIFSATVEINGQWVRMQYDSKEGSFTREVIQDGQVVSKDEYVAVNNGAEDKYGQRDYTVTRTTYRDGEPQVETFAVAKPSVSALFATTHLTNVVAPAVDQGNAEAIKSSEPAASTEWIKGNDPAFRTPTDPDPAVPGQCSPDDPDPDLVGPPADLAPNPDTAPLAPDQVDAANPAPDTSTTPNLSDLLPYAQGLNSALSLIQAVQQGNTLSAVLAGSSLAGTLNQLTDGAIPTLPGELSFGLGALSTGLNLLDALETGDELGALSAGTNLASQAAGLWANALNSQAASLAAAGNYAECVAVATEASSAAALSNTLGQVAGALNIVNSLAHGDALGAAIAAVSMVNPVAGIVLSIGRAIFGGLFGGDDEGEPAYVWINATGDGQFVRTDDGGIAIEATGTNRHKSTEGTATGPGTQGGQAVSSALGELLASLQSQVDAHNAAHPDAPMALVPERLPELHYRDPAYYAQWTDADSGQMRSIMVGRTTLADDLLTVAQSAETVVPQWVADTITQRIDAGEADAWKAEPVAGTTGDTQGRDILVLGSGRMDGTARSDLDADGWREAHAWNPANLYLAVDAKGDGRIEGFDDLVTAEGNGTNALGWLDANGDGMLDAADPGFAAIRLWLDANADATAQDNETATLDQAGIVAIDFRSWPPQLVDAQGNTTALTEAHLTGDTRGILARQADGGVLLMHEEGETVLLAERTTDYAGDEAHTHRETQEIEVGDTRLQSQIAAPQATAQTEARVGKDDERLKSAAPIVVPGAAAAVRAAEARPLGVAPQATTGQELREVTRQMIQETDTLFTAAGGLLAAVAFGAGSAQAGVPTDEALPATDSEAGTEASVAALPAAQVSVAAAALGETTPVVSSLPPAASAPAPAWTLADLAVAVVLPASPPTSPTQPTPASDNAAAPAPAFPAPMESAPAGGEGAVPAPALSPTPAVLPKTAGQATGEEQSYAPRPYAGDDTLDDRTEDVPFRISPAQLLLNDTADTPTSLHVSALGTGKHGRVEFLPDGDIAFYPDADYFGPAAFSYTVATDFGLTSQGRVSFTILPVNDAPTVPEARVDATEDVALCFDAAALLAKDSDVDNDHADLAIVAVSNASHGAVFLDPDGAVRFVPEADWFGVAGFDYTVADGVGGQTTGHIRLDLANVNDAPVASGEALAAMEDAVQLIDAAALLANDADIDNADSDLSIVAVENAVRGTVALDPDGRVRFTPEANYYGAASFDYVVADDAGGATRATVTLDIAAVNDAPVAAGETVAGKTNVPFVFTQAALLANDTDVDQDNLAIVAVGAAEHGTVTLDPDGRVRFVPETGYVGTAGFEYTVDDGAGGTATACVGIDLAHANIAPTAVDDGFTGDEDVPFVIAQSELLANDSDPDNANADLHITAVGDAQNGTVVLQEDGSIRFTPEANYNGPAKFTYIVDDQQQGQSQAEVSLEIHSINDAPIITNVEDLGNYGYIHAYDPDGDNSLLSYEIATFPVHGWVEINGFTFTIFDPYNGTTDSSWQPVPTLWVYNSTNGDPYTGSDPFQIRVRDSDGAETTVWKQTTHVGSYAGGGGGGGGGCPIAIDLNGHGVDLIAPDDSQVFEDINGDGWRDRIGWIGADDGLLALDRDGDGRVGSFREISFADDLPGARTDLEGLRAHDSDGDGFIDADDAEWSRFGIWRDVNSNGIQEDGELRSLDDMGVARIGLTGDGQLRVDHGNVVFGETSVELVSGETLIAADVMFAGQDIPYPTAVQEALAATPPELTAPPDEAELARRAQAFIQACAGAAGEGVPLGFVDATDAGWPTPAVDWHAPHEPAAA